VLICSRGFPRRSPAWCSFSTDQSRELGPHCQLLLRRTDTLTSPKAKSLHTKEPNPAPRLGGGFGTLQRSA